MKARGGNDEEKKEAKCRSLNKGKRREQRKTEKKREKKKMIKNRKRHMSTWQKIRGLK